MMPTDPTRDEPARLDKWLWAARFFKTRSLATEAVNGGRVHRNGARCKPGVVLRIGDTLRVRRGTMEQEVIVRALSSRRGPAKVAVTLYEETAASLANREKVAQVMQSMPRPESGGRPTKRQRRDYDRLSGG